MEKGGGRKGEEEGKGWESKRGKRGKSKRQRRGQAAPFIVSGHWCRAYLATAR